MSSYRPRRTRIYGANYDIGESYYKKQLDDLDNKRGIRTLDRSTDFDFPIKDDKLTPKVSFLEDDADLDSLKFNKLQKFSNSKALLGDTFGDAPMMLNTKPYTPKPILNLDDDVDIDIDNVRKNISRKTNDVSKGKTHLNDLDIQNQDSSFLSRRKLRISTEHFISSTDKSTAEEVATSRAKATKARLADLEMEMMNIVEKQTERQKRNNNLKKLLNETDSDVLKSENN